MDIQAEKAARRDALRKRKFEKAMREAGISRQQAKFALSKALRDAEEYVLRDANKDEAIDQLLKRCENLY